MIETPCGGAGTCGRCRVQFTSGKDQPSQNDLDVFSPDEIASGWRLACQTTVNDDAVITIPPGSVLGQEHKIVASPANEETDDDVSPAVRKVHVELAEPTLADDAADLMRLERKIGPFKANLEMLRTGPQILRENNFNVTAVLAENHLIAMEAGDTTGLCMGLAVDLGTTTLAASLMDLSTGRELGIESTMNPQVRFGDDVISRILYADDHPEGKQQLSYAVIEVINELIAKLCDKFGVAAENIYEISVSGNTTMEHLLCGLAVKQLGQLPFVPACARGLVLKAGELGIKIHPAGSAYIFPVIGGFVGGDTVACLLASSSLITGPATLLVDVGTNGEIVLCHDGKMMAASTAAGPAFEGARISCGMRASCGAIEKVVFNNDVRLGIIGGCEAAGLCGSGLIDLVAEMLRAGIVSETGGILTGSDLPADLPEKLAERVKLDSDSKPCFVLKEATDSCAEITLTQRDIRELQLGTGAIRAGISILLRQAGLDATDLSKVIMAGGFGNFIRRSNAQRIGLLPGNISHQKIQYVGNASLQGARLALLSTTLRKNAENLARQASHVELSQDMNFQMEFAEAMIFPDS